MAAIFNSSFQTLSPQPTRLKAKSTESTILNELSYFEKSAKPKATDLPFC